MQRRRTRSSRLLSMSVLELPDAAGRDLAEPEPVAGPDAFLEDLGHALVEPDGHVGADRGVGELVERLVLERPPQRVAALAFEERGQQVAAGHEHAAGVAAAVAGEAEVVLLPAEEVDLQRRGMPLSAREVDEPARVLLVHRVHAAGEVVGEVGVEVGVDAVVPRASTACRERRRRRAGAAAQRQQSGRRARARTHAQRGHTDDGPRSPHGTLPRDAVSASHVIVPRRPGVPARPRFYFPTRITIIVSLLASGIICQKRRSAPTSRNAARSADSCASSGVDPFGQAAPKGVTPLATDQSVHTARRWATTAGPSSRWRGGSCSSATWASSASSRSATRPATCRSRSTRSGSTRRRWEVRDLIDLGDQIVVEGPLGTTKKGETTVWATSRRDGRQGAAPAAGEVAGAGRRRAALPPAVRRPVGEPRGDAAAEAAHPRSSTRSASTCATRGFLEVETPMMQPLARRRRGAAVRHAPQRARHPALPAHRPGAVPQAPARRRVQQGLRAQPQLPQRRHQPAPQPRVHDARGLRGVRHLGDDGRPGRGDDLPRRGEGVRHAEDRAQERRGGGDARRSTSAARGGACGWTNWWKSAPAGSSTSSPSPAPSATSCSKS